MVYFVVLHTGLVCVVRRGAAQGIWALAMVAFRPWFGAFRFGYRRRGVRWLLVCVVGVWVSALGARVWSAVCVSHADLCVALGDS